MIKKLLCMLYGTLFCMTNMMFAQAQKNKDVAYYEVGKPVIISLSNKSASSGAWEISDTNPQQIQVNGKKNGYIFTYFEFTVLNDAVKNIHFSSGKQTRTFLLKPLSSLTPPIKQEIYGDIPSLSQTDGFLSQMNQPSQIFDSTADNTNGHLNHADNLTPSDTSNQKSQSIQPKNPTQMPVATSNSSIAQDTTEQRDIPISNNLASLDSNSALSQDDQNSSLPANPVSQMSPADIEKNQLYIQNLLDNKLYTDALPVVEKLLDQNIADKSPLYLDILNINQNMGNYQEAVENADKYLALENIPVDTAISIRLIKSNALNKLGQPTSAEAQLVYLKSFYPDNPSVHEDIADFYMQQKQYDKAKQEFNYMLGHFPNYEHLDKVYYDLGTINYLSNKNNLSTAMGYYKKVLDFGLASPYYQKSYQMVDFLENNLLNYR